MKDITHLHLAVTTKRLARMSAARRGVSLTQHITDLIRDDARRIGIADLVEESDVLDEEERHAE